MCIQLISVRVAIIIIMFLMFLLIFHLSLIPFFRRYLLRPLLVFTLVDLLDLFGFLLTDFLLLTLDYLLITLLNWLIRVDLPNSHTNPPLAKPKTLNGFQVPERIVLRDVIHSLHKIEHIPYLNLPVGTGRHQPVLLAYLQLPQTLNALIMGFEFYAVR
jgi:hypothetical protein